MGLPIEAPLSAQRRSFQVYLRTGQRITVASGNSVELKFNPYHDLRNGRFTFAPGGPRIAPSRNSRPRRTDSDVGTGGSSLGVPFTSADARPSGVLTDAADRQETATPIVALTQYRPGPPMASGGNIRAFNDPMTLEQVFPGLRTVPGGSIIAAIDPLDIFGPGLELQAGLNADIAKSLVRQIKAIDPNYRFESLGPPTSSAGQINQNNALRFDRAAALFRVRGEIRPLQVETLKFLRARTNAAYTDGLELLRQGKLKIRLSKQEALGNFVDGRVRVALRNLYHQLDISTVRGQQVRVNAREYSSEKEGTFRRPDARVGKVAFDVTLSEKTLATPQVRGFFWTDFKPEQVIIVRPSQLGSNSVYAITRPEAMR